MGAAIDDAWHHYALSRAGSVMAFFIDGLLVTTVGSDGTVGSPTSALHIGWSLFQQSPSDATWQGHFADIRVVKGTALYTCVTKA